jgi:hypothetical protein
MTRTRFLALLVAALLLAASAAATGVSPEAWRSPVVPSSPDLGHDDFLSASSPFSLGLEEAGFVEVETVETPTGSFVELRPLGVGPCRSDGNGGDGGDVASLGTEGTEGTLPV